MADDLFLTPDEVQTLTGIAKGRLGRTREQLQIDWLSRSGIPFWTNARGRPVVSRSAITGAKPKEVAAPGPWVPRVMGH